MRTIVYVLLATIVATTLISLVGPNVDLTVAGLFYDPAGHRFPLVRNGWFVTLRENGRVAIITAIGVGALALTPLLPWRLPSIRPRSALALILALLLGPGLLVNGVLKPHGGRPRPLEVTQFGGPLPFVDWWNPTGACDGNCSFMSGEAATAAWMFGPAMLVPPPWRALAIGAAAAFTIAIGFMRVAAGGHFLSDVLVGAFSTIVILLLMNRWITGASGALPVSSTKPRQPPV